MGVVAILLVIVVLTPESSWHRLMTVFELEDDYNMSGRGGRIAIWSRGIEAFLSRPWGYGAGVFQSVDMRAGGQYLTAHNSLIQVAVELGIELIVPLPMAKDSYVQDFLCRRSRTLASSKTTLRGASNANLATMRLRV